LQQYSAITVVKLKVEEEVVAVDVVVVEAAEVE